MTNVNDCNLSECVGTFDNIPNNCFELLIRNIDDEKWKT